MSEKRIREDSESLLVALIRDHANVHDGNQRAFAQRVGIGEQTLSRWIRGVNDPSADHYDLLSEELGYSRAELHYLGLVSLQDACKLIIEFRE